MSKTKWLSSADQVDSHHRGYDAGYDAGYAVGLADGQRKERKELRRWANAKRKFVSTDRADWYLAYSELCWMLASRAKKRNPQR